MSWVYIESEPGLFTVGFYAPDGKWYTDSYHSDREGAAGRVNFLNGGYRGGPPQGERVPTIVPMEDMRERWDSTRRHILAAIEMIEPLLLLPRDEPTKAALGNARVSLDSNELLLAWEDVHGAVLNSGGEPFEVRPPSGFWFQMAEAARMMIED